MPCFPDASEETSATAIGYEAIKQGMVVLYRSIFDVVRDFLHEEMLDQDDKLLARYLMPDLLIVDDMGMKQLPRRNGEVLFETIMRRYETRSTMMTSIRPLEDWGKLIGDVLSRADNASAHAHRFETVTADTVQTPSGCGRERDAVFFGELTQTDAGFRKQ